MIIRLYYDNTMLDQWWRGSHYSSLWSVSQNIKDICAREIYDGGYLAVTPNKQHGTEWYRCDLTPVLQVEVPKELLVLELLDPPC